MVERRVLEDEVVGLVIGREDDLVDVEVVRVRVEELRVDEDDGLVVRVLRVDVELERVLVELVRVLVLDRDDVELLLLDDFVVEVVVLLVVDEEVDVVGFGVLVDLVVVSQVPFLFGFVCSSLILSHFPLVSV